MAARTVHVVDGSRRVFDCEAMTTSDFRHRSQSSGSVICQTNSSLSCACRTLCKRYTHEGMSLTRINYLVFFAFSARNFAHRSLVAFDILALAAADIVRLRLTPG